MALALLALLLLSSRFSSSSSSRKSADSIQPRPWPLQFHSLCVQTLNGELATIDLWYDWINGRNFNIIHKQLGARTYDLEWTNGTSFVYNLEQRTCHTLQVPVGILRPNWLDGARYLGTQDVNGFRCNVWSKLDFITYYEDTKTKVPVRWIFYTGRVIDVMTFQEGATLADSEWQAPIYCIDKPGTTTVRIREPEERWTQAVS